MGRWIAQIRNEVDSQLTKPGSVSFVSTPVSIFSLLESFFISATTLGCELLPDDKRWIKNLCNDTPLYKLKFFLDQYTTHWLIAMKDELKPHKQQNVGRFAANTFLRESLGKRTDKTDKTKSEKIMNDTDWFTAIY